MWTCCWTASSEADYIICKRKLRGSCWLCPNGYIQLSNDIPNDIHHNEECFKKQKLVSEHSSCKDTDIHVLVDSVKWKIVLSIMHSYGLAHLAILLTELARCPDRSSDAQMLHAWAVDVKYAMSDTQQASHENLKRCDLVQLRRSLWLWGCSEWLPEWRYGIAKVIWMVLAGPCFYDILVPWYGTQSSFSVSPLAKYTKCLRKVLVHLNKLHDWSIHLLGA